MRIKLILTTLTLFSIFSIQKSNAQNTDFEWIKLIGGSSYQGESSLVVDDENNIYNIGAFQGTVDFDPGPGNFNITSSSLSLYIQKLNPNGDLIWVKNVGGTDYVGSASITIDNNNNICITGTHSGSTDFDPGPGVFNVTVAGLQNMYVLKLDSNGDFIWAKSFGILKNNIGGFLAISAAHDNDDNVYITGSFVDTLDFDLGIGTNYLYSYGEKDIMILKLDANGDFVWVKQMGGIGYDEAWDLAIGTDENLYVSGWFNDTADFNLVNNTPLISNGGYNMFIQKLDLNGNSIWIKQMKGSGWNGCRKIALDEYNNIYITGLFTDTVDFDPGLGESILISNGDKDIFVQKLDFNGNLLWVKQMGGPSEDQSWGITAKHGYVYTTGNFADTVDFNPNADTLNFEGSGQADAFIQALSTNGDFIWAKQIGGNYISSGNTVALDAYNNLYTLGGFYDTAYFDIGGVDSSLISLGSRDVFIYKLSISEPIGINEISQDITLTLSPNPSKDIFNINFSEELEQAELIITNIQGQIISATKIEHLSKTSIDLKNQPLGVYFLTIKLDKAPMTIRLIKE